MARFAAFKPESEEHADVLRCSTKLGAELGRKSSCISEKPPVSRSWRKASTRRRPRRRWRALRPSKPSRKNMSTCCAGWTVRSSSWAQNLAASARTGRRPSSCRTASVSSRSSCSTCGARSSCRCFAPLLQLQACLWRSGFPVWLLHRQCQHQHAVAESGQMLTAFEITHLATDA